MRTRLIFTRTIDLDGRLRSWMQGARFYQPRCSRDALSAFIGRTDGFSAWSDGIGRRLLLQSSIGVEVQLTAQHLLTFESALDCANTDDSSSLFHGVDSVLATFWL